MDVDTDSVQGRVLSAMKELCSKHGGPRQYLSLVLRSAVDHCNFYQGLLDMLPPAHDCSYHDISPIVQVAELSGAPLVFHPTQFSWSAESTIKGAPEAKVVLALTETMLSDGFITAGDPLLVASAPIISSLTPPDPPFASAQALPAFSVGCVKGNARVTTLMCVLSFFVFDKVSLQ